MRGNDKDIININGAETRRMIDDMAGRAFGILKVCTSKGLPSEPINKACLRGYTTRKVYKLYKDAGVPVVRSRNPKPCRVKAKHDRKSPEGTPIQLKLEDIGTQADLPAGNIPAELPAYTPKTAEKDVKQEIKNTIEYMIGKLVELEQIIKAL